MKAAALKDLWPLERPWIWIWLIGIPSASSEARGVLRDHLAFLWTVPFSLFSDFRQVDVIWYFGVFNPANGRGFCTKELMVSTNFNVTFSTTLCHTLYATWICIQDTYRKFFTDIFWFC